MLRSYVAAALRNLRRGKLYAAINVFGLAAGFAVAILAALYVRDELNYDAFVPGAERVFNLYTHFEQPGRAPLVVDTATVVKDFSEAMQSELPGVEAVARLGPEQQRFRRGDFAATERMYWADPSIFAVLPLPAVEGDLSIALAQAGSVVIPRRIAVKYFGAQSAVGQTLELDGAGPLKITAVIDDFPSISNLAGEIFVAGQARFALAGQATTGGAQQRIAHVFLRLRSAEAANEVQRALPGFINAHMPAEVAARTALELVALKDIHFHASDLPALRAANDPAVVYGIGVVAGLVLLIACINFVNLMTARAMRRALEVGVRKTAGATRANLFLQFVGEAGLYVAAGLVLALGAVEAGLLPLNAFLQRAIALSYWQDPILSAALAGGGLLVAFLVGAYPALVLSSFSPLAVLRGLSGPMLKTRGAREVLVVGQFAILIGLIASTFVIARQMQFALGQGLGLDTAQTVLLTNTDCRQILRDRIEAVPGVNATVCSSFFALNMGQAEFDIAAENGTAARIYAVAADPGFLDFYGVRPVAGRLLSDERGQDLAPDTADGSVRSIVLNQRAVERLGFASPEAALNQTVRWDLPGGARAFTVVGVVPDFTFKALRQRIDPAGYFADPAANAILNIRLDANRPAGTLQTIDAIAREIAPERPTTRMFVSGYLLYLYGDVLRQALMLAGLGVLALLVSCLGLLGLAAFVAEGRTKEIGIRKVMGADRRAVLRRVVWDLIKPALLANVIAWPAAYYAMSRWLAGFAYRIDPEAWMFAAAGALALVIAVLTVSGHAFRVARARPVAALRYE